MLCILIAKRDLLMIKKPNKSGGGEFLLHEMISYMHKEHSLGLNWEKNKQKVNVLHVYRLNIP